MKKQQNATPSKNKQVLSPDLLKKVAGGGGGNGGIGPGHPGSHTGKS